MFEDKKSAPYSIHQIALMGVSYGKQVGEWFGPNTIAQVLKWVLVGFPREKKSYYMYYCFAENWLLWMN